mgnify:FL=1
MLLLGDTGIDEGIILRASGLRVAVQDDIEEDFGRGFHGKLANHSILIHDTLLWRQVSGFDQQLLQLEQVQLHIVIVVKELVDVIGSLDSCVLVTNALDRSLHFFLHILDFFCSHHQLFGRSENFFVFFSLGFGYFSFNRDLLTFLIFDKGLHMLPELFIAIKALITLI